MTAHVFWHSRATVSLGHFLEIKSVEHKDYKCTDFHNTFIKFYWRYTLPRKENFSLFLVYK